MKPIGIGLHFLLRYLKEQIIHFHTGMKTLTYCEGLNLKKEGQNK